MDTHANFIEEDESIQRCELNITLIVDEITFGKGTLYVAESKLYWKNYAISQVVSIDYKSMCVFGTCNHPVVHEKPCLQIIVDFAYKPDSIQSENGQTLNGDNHSNEDDNSEDDNEVDQNEDEEEGEMKSKIKLVPDSPECLNEIYEAFTRVQPLHNSNDEDSEEEAEEDDDFYYNENDEFEDYDEDDAVQILRN